MDMAGCVPAIFISGGLRVLSLYRRYAVPVVWLTVLFVYLAAIMPGPEAPDLGAGDKVNHIAAFVTLTFLGRVAYRLKPAWRLGVALSLFGALIELTQAIPFIHRDASFWDWAADTAAILAALPICFAIERYHPVRVPA